MQPIDEFENDLRKTHPRPLSSSAIEAVESRLQKLQLQQHTVVPPRRASRMVFAGVWSSGFAFGAAAMLLVSSWLSQPREQSSPRVTHPPRQVTEESTSIAVEKETTLVERLVSYPLRTPPEPSFRRVPEILSVGSDPSTLFDRSSVPPRLHSLPGHETKFLPSDVTPDRYRSRAPATRRELIDQILNEV